MASTGMLIDGIFASEAIDTSGERINIKGLDISEFDAGHGVANYEHKGEDKGNGDEIVGRVVYAKKILEKDDCDNDRQRSYWDRVKQPYLYGIIRLSDGAGHEGAKALAASIRDHAANGEKILVRYSIEGSTTLKQGNDLKECIARRVALTYRPCNRSCDSGILEDPLAPDGFEKIHHKKDDFDFSDSNKSEHEHPMYTRLGGSVDVESDPILEESDLTKTLTAGSYDAAPSTLSGGAALQKESLTRSRVITALRDATQKRLSKEELRAFIKHKLPEISDEFLDHFADAVDDLKVKRSLLKHSELTAAIESLKKAVADLPEHSKNIVSKFNSPKIHKVDVKIGDSVHRAGRFMIHNGNLHHLEDHHGILERNLPQGPVTSHTKAIIDRLKMNPNIGITDDSTPANDNDKEDHKTDEKDADTAPHLPTVPPQPRPASVFHYTRAGHDTPHTLEVHNGHYLLDGKKLSHPEVQTILQNIKTKAAKIRYSKSETVSRVAKMEQLLKGWESLSKADNEMDPEDALQQMREVMGHDHPAVKAMTRHTFEDPNTGLGNKYAATKFYAKKRPGVYVGLDGNSFSSINNNYGHAAGDQAISAMGHAVKAAAEEVAPGAYKSFRQGGDEFGVFLPSHEHAAKFARALHRHLDAVPAVGGTHKLSMGIGIGTSPEHADKALYAAKEQKYTPDQLHIDPRQRKKAFPVGQEPSMAHSLVPGHEGPIKLHDENAAAIHAVSKLPNSPAPTAEPHQPSAH